MICHRVRLSLLVASLLILVGCSAQPDQAVPGSTQEVASPDEPIPATEEAAPDQGQDIPGISSPLTVEGAEIQVAQAYLTDTYVGGYAINAPSADETLLVVKVDVLSAESALALMAWSVTLTDDSRQTIDSTTGEVTANADMKSGVATWVFAVLKTAQTFILNLPDGQTIDLSSLVER